MGGPSAEREISLVSGKAVCDNLDKDKYTILPIEISKQGKFFLDNNFYKQLNTSSEKKNNKKELISFDNQLTNKKVDMMFIALHGPYGEDGCIQGMLESFGIKYTGSGVLASALAMNKAKTFEIYQQNGFNVANQVDFKIKDWQKNKAEIIKRIKTKIKFPVVIKPVDQGSSVGIYIVKKEKDLVDKINSSFLYTKWVIAQEFIKGREVTCGVLEKNDQEFTTSVTEIISNAGEFYDLASKYEDGGSTHICPAELNKTITKKIQELTLKAHQILGCKAMSRTDFFVTKTGKIFVIETNTIPGMTSTSLLPEAAGKMGISFSKMLDLIIKASLE